ncbi:helix-turn-helix transcriptional regulator [Vibrio sp. RE86]|uniref:helix-turn-helix domain-containing protein n=1 Tax=Vibrio sp. RE86 TaxID=2607605 RepID=UPI0014935B9B|nr:helix-turn-helix transcriptional regulator [Vibrio sp. RE86]NOH81001.1 helix-turn-helix transcriptional regulator [Vibrio sp. RE86]
MFGEIIKEFRTKNGLSQTEFVDAVQRSNDDFNNLDVVTLSRWERGVTKPHLTRQNELLDLIGVDIFTVWDKEGNVKSLPSYYKKLKRSGYIDVLDTLSSTVLIINATNMYELRRHKELIELVFEFESNVLFSEMLQKGMTRLAIMENLIDQHNGELNLVTFYGQLIGHVLTVNKSALQEHLTAEIELEEDIHLVASFNCISPVVVKDTLGREAYKYIHSLNPERKMCILQNDKKMFDLLFSLGFEYKTLRIAEKSSKLMSIESKKIKSQRSWMNLIAQYKGEENE